MVGGRTNHWGRISLRFGPEDFKAKSRDGLGDDWPIAYSDLAPYYDRIDKLIGVFGNNDNLPNHPGGYFLPPPPPRCYELMVKDAADRLNIWCVASRLSVITKAHNGRMACHYCGQCGRGCKTNSNFSSTNVLIAPALKTGRLTLVTHAMAREVTLNNRGLASGVTYIDTKSGAERHADARVVVLAASACETARLMLNSKSPQFPNGLANSSGVVGKYLTDTTGTDVGGFIPKMVDHVPHNEDGVGGNHIYMPWWVDNKKLDFPRGYHIEVGGGLNPPSYGFMGGIQRYPGGGGYGKALKEDYRRYYGAQVYFAGRGEMIPNDKSYCEIDPVVKDKYGIPCAALPLAVDRLRVQPGSAHATDLPCVGRGDGRPGVRQDAGAAEGVRDRARRRDHPRAGDSPHGRRSVEVRARPELPGARREESVRDRWRPVRLAGRQESDLDHTRALDADERIHRARAEAGGTLMSNENENPNAKPTDSTGNETASHG